ncbi:uracil nucleotide/cysteinyl leukotriene receptor-like [Triplophysa rosa]|uniref:uracil nucleotide/cysteinyl leukotriene receptor-like n=1 Tax=Triplophysa rosa TaxID=992332 RepID=UPI00254631E1|nr:uracil nucleotide/cysteinyl leukotriene receptor-like [Triplophysa rosa]
MNSTTLNFSTSGASTNIITNSFGDIGNLEICVYSFNVLFGLPTHTFVIWLIMTGSKSGTASEFFFLNLSACEIGICLDGLLSVLAQCVSGLYNLSMLLQGFAVTGRPLFQCLICVERYLAVVHPVTFLKYKPLRYRLMCAAVAWIICLCSCLCCILLLILCTTDIYTCFFLQQFLLFLSINLFCCLAVLRALKQSGPGERGRAREEENHMKRRAFYLIFITTVSMIITYVPYVILGISVILKTQFVYGFWFTGLICYVMAGFVQPVLYLHRAGKLSHLCPNICIC